MASAPAPAWVELASLPSFVGRERELVILDRLRAERARLVTITGSGGMGKTRIAQEWARRCGEASVFCDLSECRDLDDACAAVARALGVPLLAVGSSDDAVDELGRALRSAGLSVVVLDNMEQLVEHAPRMLGPWLSLANSVSFVVTSRERLRLATEVCVELEPLALPPLETRAGELVDFAASQLFVASAARAGVQFSDEDAASIAEIVRRLEGVPLAIELCAARADVLAPRQLLAWLARPFELLSGGARGAPTRQTALRATIDGSWELLAPHERSVFAQCSVFRGGFSIDAALRVLDGGPGAPPVLDVLQALHRKSLVRVSTTDSARGERRFGLLECLREYAEEKLALTGEGENARARHERYFLGCFADPGAAQLPRLDARRLSVDADNLLAVCTRALASKPLDAERADAALRALLLLDPVLLASAAGRLDPYLAMLDEALSVEGPATVVRARALFTLATAELLRGRVAESLLRFRSALEAARACRARADEARALTRLAVLFDLAEHPDEASERFETAKAIVRELDDPALEGDLLVALAGAELWRGHAQNALALARTALTHARTTGDRRYEAVALAQLAQASLSVGRVEDAQDLSADSLAVLSETQDRRTEGYVLAIQGRVAQSRGRFAEARERLLASIAIHRGVGDRMLEGVVSRYLATVELEQGRYEEARATLVHAAKALSDTGDRQYLAMASATIAVIDARLGDARSATRHFEVADRAADGIETLSTRHVLALARAHAALASSDDRSREGRVEDAVAAIAKARAPSPEGGPGAADSSEDVRVAIRALEQTLALATGATDAATTVTSKGDRASVLVVGPEARWFRVGDERSVRLQKSRAARLILARLARERIDAPGRGLALEALFAAGWPGEQALASAARNRVYVTLTRLRQMGLAKLIQSRDDGFLLDPEAAVVEVVREEPED